MMQNLDSDMSSCNHLEFDIVNKPIDKYRTVFDW